MQNSENILITTSSYYEVNEKITGTFYIKILRLICLNHTSFFFSHQGECLN